MPRKTRKEDTTTTELSLRLQTLRPYILHQRILLRMRKKHTTYHLQLTAIEALTSNHPISLPPDSSKAKQQWRFLVQNQEPSMTQLACMNMATVLEVVKLLKTLLAGIVRSRGQEKIERLGAWIWSVLAKCSEAGQLGSEEISELRELGKRAVGLLVGIRDRSGKAYSHEEDEEVPENGEESNGGQATHQQGGQAPGGRNGLDRVGTETTPEGWAEMSKLDRAKVALQEQLSSEREPQHNGELAEEGEVEKEGHDEKVEMSVEKQVRIMLDMIITVVGEFYGQRDLLEFRDIWDDEPGSSRAESGQIEDPA
jgi:Survival motor neuron (SMN) interacting protein 1 (SIP1)